MGLAASVESWLEAQTSLQPGQPIVWAPRSGRRVDSVGNAEHLAVLVSRIPQVGDWGVLEWGGTGSLRWCQTMRLDAGWIVEAHDGTSTDFAQRVYRGEPGTYPAGTSSQPHPIELWQPYAAAHLMWAWLHGNLPEGCARTMRHVSSPGGGAI